MGKKYEDLTPEEKPGWLAERAARNKAVFDFILYAIKLIFESFLRG